MRNDYTDYLYHGKFFNSDGSKKDHKYESRKWVKGKWQYIYKTADKLTNGLLTKAHDKKFDKHMNELKDQRESGYAAEAKAKTDKFNSKVSETKHNVEFNTKMESQKKERETNKAKEEKQKAEQQQKAHEDYRKAALTKKQNKAMDERGKSIAAEMKAKQDDYDKSVANKKREAELKTELEQYDKAAWTRKASQTYFDLDFNMIDREDVGSTIDETAKINPDYNPKNPATSQNCGFCATAWVMRKKGYDVEARADDENVTWNDIDYSTTGVSNWDIENFFVDPSKYTGRNSIDNTFSDDVRKGYTYKTDGIRVYGYKSSEGTKDTAEKTILENSKEGDYGIITVSWNGGGGHALNYQVENGKVIIYDGQVNRSYSIDELTSNAATLKYINCTSLIPTDNTELVVQNRRK